MRWAVNICGIVNNMTSFADEPIEAEGHTAVPGFEFVAQVCKYKSRYAVLADFGFDIFVVDVVVEGSCCEVIVCVDVIVAFFDFVKEGLFKMFLGGHVVSNDTGDAPEGFVE